MLVMWLSLCFLFCDPVSGFMYSLLSWYADTFSFSVLCELWSVWRNGFLLFHYYSSILKFHLGIFVFMEFECLLKWFTVLVLGCESSVNFSFSAELIIFHECSSLSVFCFFPIHLILLCSPKVRLFVSWCCLLLIVC